MVRVDTRRLAIAGVVLVVTATSLGWGYSAYSRWQARKAALALVQDTATRVRAALGGEAHVPPAAGTDVIAGLEADLGRVEGNYADYRRLDAAKLGALADAADDFLLTAREMLRRIAIGGRARVNLGASSEALRSHMGADRGRAGWPGEAVRLRERVDRDYREFRLASETLVKLIDAFPASQEKLAGQLGTSLLIDTQLLAAARTAITEKAKHVSTEIEQLTNLASYR